MCLSGCLLACMVFKTSNYLNHHMMCCQSCAGKFHQDCSACQVANYWESLEQGV